MEELNIPVIFNNGCTVSIIPKHHYNSQERTLLDSKSIGNATGCNTVTAASLWYKSKRVLFGKHAFAQLGCWQYYMNRIVYPK